MLFPLHCCQLVPERGLVGLRWPLAVSHQISSLQPPPPLSFTVFSFPHAVLSFLLCKWVSSCWWREGLEGSRAPVEKESLIKPLHPLIHDLWSDVLAVLLTRLRPNPNPSNSENLLLSCCCREARLRSVCGDHVVPFWKCCRAPD